MYIPAWLLIIIEFVFTVNLMIALFSWIGLCAKYYNEIHESEEE